MLKKAYENDINCGISVFYQGHTSIEDGLRSGDPPVPPQTRFIFQNDLKILHVLTRMVPKMLSPDQKQIMSDIVKVCNLVQDFIYMINADDYFLKEVVTGDETHILLRPLEKMSFNSIDHHEVRKILLGPKQG
ncbi:hypothetical protein CEXT_155431 [Caerostris extrusa]|uniref:Uncharacterized protein n=1 Tax=Caerostris extrusa TaxID=172846 RepID=A0AAV4WY87_CAEEX|nr:hypothetical protein CEXT_155431 [Caerostris extrusa]